jgi:hypothetical protein
VDRGTRRGADGGGAGRLTIREAALALGISEGAVRKRVDRGTLEHTRGEDGRIYVVLPNGVDEGETASTTADADRERLIKFLSEQLEHEREVNRENRRIIAGLVQRIPALEEASSEPQRGPLSADEGTGRGEEEQQEHSQRRSWWRQFLGME